MVSFDQQLAARIRALVAKEAGLSERRMFGGLAFLIDGNMAVSASGGGGMLLRVPPKQTGDLAELPHAERFAMRGREMDGWLRVDLDGVRSDDALERWVAIGVAYARALPPKP